MKRSNIDWNEAKWNKMMSVVDECLSIIKISEPEESAEDIFDMVRLMKKRVNRIISSDESWAFRKTALNAKYTVLKREFEYINNLAVNQKFAGWWK
jgi:hypothetical protein